MKKLAELQAESFCFFTSFTSFPSCNAFSTHAMPFHAHNGFPRVFSSLHVLQCTYTPFYTLLHVYTPVHVILTYSRIQRPSSSFHVLTCHATHLHAPPRHSRHFHVFLTYSLIQYIYTSVHVILRTSTLL